MLHKAGDLHVCPLIFSGGMPATLCMRVQTPFESGWLGNPMSGTTTVLPLGNASEPLSHSLAMCLQWAVRCSMVHVLHVSGGGCGEAGTTGWCIHGGATPTH